jgi:hypothetical protein
LAISVGVASRTKVIFVRSRILGVRAFPTNRRDQNIFSDTPATSDTPSKPGQNVLEVIYCPADDFD